GITEGSLGLSAAQRSDTPGQWSPPSAPRRVCHNRTNSRRVHQSLAPPVGVLIISGALTRGIAALRSAQPLAYLLATLPGCACELPRYPSHLKESTGELSDLRILPFTSAIELRGPWHLTHF